MFVFVCYSWTINKFGQFISNMCLKWVHSLTDFLYLLVSEINSTERVKKVSNSKIWTFLLFNKIQCIFVLFVVCNVFSFQNGSFYLGIICILLLSVFPENYLFFIERGPNLEISQISNVYIHNFCFSSNFGFY